MVAPACFAVLAWAVVLNGGSIGPSFKVSANISNPTYYGWLWMQALNSGFGGCSALIVAQADIARWARKPSDQTCVLPALFGILVASATSNFWGKGYWNLWDVLSLALDYYEMSPASRGLVFLASFAFAVAILGTNVAANSLPFASNLTGLMPRYISIQRGQVLCALLVFPIVPWKIIESAASLLTFLSGYSILMGPFAAICRAVPPRYYRGWNLRAIVAWLIGVELPFPGFVASFGTVTVATGASRMWYMGYILGIVMSGAAYYVLFLVFPDPSIENGLAFESLAVEVDEIEGQAEDAKSFEEANVRMERGEVKDSEKI
ncbi:permease for cytosine/purines, uracil, thiamine, allantoin-domain-containing protein [Xylariales sp. PMI_506]|nr:permease for cytosine/purines, uracil, thiamine, allantoin-domain-containing protein [Xylariales sp. PMI_506]